MAEPNQNWTGVWLLKSQRKTLCVTQKIIQSSFTSVTLYLEVKWLWLWHEDSCKRKQKLAKCKVKMLMQNQTCWLEVFGGNQPMGEELFRFWTKMAKFWKIQLDFCKEFLLYIPLLASLAGTFLKMMKWRPSDMLELELKQVASILTWIPMVIALPTSSKWPLWLHILTWSCWPLPRVPPWLHPGPHYICFVFIFCCCLCVAIL